MLSDEERDRLAEHLFPDGAFNVSLIGSSAETIAESAGIRVPRGTRVLLVKLERIGDDYPLSREKLCPVLGFYEVAKPRGGAHRLPRHGAPAGRRAIRRRSMPATRRSSCASGRR